MSESTEAPVATAEAFACKPDITFGFIITRCVVCPQTNQYWKLCYNSIRIHHPDAPVLIIDDNSNPDFLTGYESSEVGDIQAPFVNCTIVYEREFNGAGELLPLLYFHRMHPFDVACCLHDSVLVNKPFETKAFHADEPFLPLWHFKYNTHQREQVLELLPYLPEGPALERLFDTHIDGVFGVMGIISWNALDALEKRFHFLRILPSKVKTRCHRCAIERIMALMNYMYHNGHTSPSLFGNIFLYMPWGTPFEKACRLSHLPLIKFWTGR
jgi:hypothetical protein